MATLKKKWDWSLILAGILLLACGLLCCFAPNLTLATIAMIAGVGFLLSGVLGIVFYVRRRMPMVQHPQNGQQLRVVSTAFR